MKILTVRLSRLFDFLHRHVHPETFQLANQPLALLIHSAPLEVVAAHVLRAPPGLQAVIGDHQNTVAHGYERFLPVTAKLTYTGVLQISDEQPQPIVLPAA